MLWSNFLEGIYSMNMYIIKEDRSKINNLLSYLSQLEEEK